MRTITCLLLSIIATSASAVPLEFNHQGRLMDSTGLPLDGVHSLTLSLYTTETGGSAFWSETQPLDFDTGYYSSVLGTATLNLIDSDDIDGNKLWLGVTVDAGPSCPPAWRSTACRTRFAP